MRFVVAADKIEILVTNRLEFIGQIDIERELESCAMLNSLMDEVRFGGGAANEPLIRMTKSKVGPRQNNGILPSSNGTHT